MKKKIITLCLVIALLSVAVIGGTLAYFTDVDQATNEFTVGGVTIDLYEEVNHVDAVGNIKDESYDVDDEGNKTDKPAVLGKGTDDYQYHEYKAVMPGDKLTKIVTVENTDTEGAYIALAIKQLNYGTTPNGVGGWDNWAASNFWNARIDSYYEGYKEVNGQWVGMPDSSVEKVKQEGRGFAPYTDEQMQNLTSSIFTGEGWNDLLYTKDGESNMRYYPTTAGAVDQDGSESYIGGTEPVLIAVDYSVQGHGKHNGNMLTLNDENKNVYDECQAGSRIWVYYIYLPAKNIDENGKNLSSMTLDLSMTVPAEAIDEFSIEAFEGLVLDVRASAIQASGFASAVDAFKALEKVYSYGYDAVPAPTEDENP